MSDIAHTEHVSPMCTYDIREKRPVKKPNIREMTPVKRD